MNFSTTEFLFIFLPIGSALFYAVPRQFRLFVIVTMSLFFYGMSGDMALALLVSTIIFSACAALIITLFAKKLLFWAAVSVPFTLLFLFKYLSFSLDAFGANEEIRGSVSFLLQYVIPAGISFYTFQTVSYLIDVRDRNILPEKNFMKLAAFICFFPQLIAGPILRFNNISPQLDRIANAKRLYPDLRLAIKYISYGLAYKILFSDILRSMHDQHDLTSSGSLDVLFAFLSYSLIIFFDFWSYSLMAIGLAKIFCIDLPRNFDEPYKSSSPKEFWRKWHITLSYWLRDYLYIKLGGQNNYVRNILIVFLACGVWHGAGWNFLVWGLYHAVLVIVYHLTREFWDSRNKVLMTIVTFFLISLGWPLFYLDFSSFVSMLGILLSFSGAQGELQYGLFSWGYLTLVMAWTFGVSEKKVLFNDHDVLFFDSPIVIGLVFSISVLFLHFSQTFIYFNF